MYIKERNDSTFYDQESNPRLLAPQQRLRALLNITCYCVFPFTCHFCHSTFEPVCLGYLVLGNSLYNKHLFKRTGTFNCKCVAL